MKTNPLKKGVLTENSAGLGNGDPEDGAGARGRTGGPHWKRRNSIGNACMTRDWN